MLKWAWDVRKGGEHKKMNLEVRLFMPNSSIVNEKVKITINDDDPASLINKISEKYPELKGLKEKISSQSVLLLRNGIRIDIEKDRLTEGDKITIIDAFYGG
ncbi:MAG: hypothetical protein PWQ82_1052 [Thermosediminibacterales bacterium]|nr:hypothetical protein [Thermosediminibacterales bacterium]MDK2836299.1 hypothetical protein [Thermosediminibacterales bacterium]